MKQEPAFWAVCACGPGYGSNAEGKMAKFASFEEAKAECAKRNGGNTWTGSIWFYAPVAMY